MQRVILCIAERRGPNCFASCCLPDGVAFPHYAREKERISGRRYFRDWDLTNTREAMHFAACLLLTLVVQGLALRNQITGLGASMTSCPR